MTGGNIEIQTVQSDLNNVSIYLIFIFSQFHAKVSDYRSVGLSSHRHATPFNVPDSKDISVSSQNIHVMTLLL